MECAHDDPEQGVLPRKSSLNVPDARAEDTGHALQQVPGAKDATVDSTPRVAIYLRVASTRLDGDNAFLGLRARCKAEARIRELRITHEYRDVARGMTLDRPRLNALRDAVRRGDLDAVYNCPIIVADDWPQRQDGPRRLPSSASEGRDHTVIEPSASTSHQPSEQDGVAAMGNLLDIPSITSVTLPPIPFLNGPLFSILLKQAIAHRGGLPLTSFPLRAAIEREGATEPFGDPIPQPSTSLRLRGTSSTGPVDRASGSAVAAGGVLVIVGGKKGAVGATGATGAAVVGTWGTSTVGGGTAEAARL